ncbi:MAG: hypothetical protein ACFCVA_09565 [Gammaproteobacteria bacterium]
MSVSVTMMFRKLWRWFQYPRGQTLMTETAVGLDRPAAAVERILAAEREANAAVERCRQAAEEVVQEGHKQARRILERADRRIARVHGIVDTAIERELACVGRERVGMSARPEIAEAERQAMARAAKVLMADLTGASAPSRLAP